MKPAKKKILIVDDTEDIREFLAVLFRLRGCEPILATDGREALDRAARCVPDLVLMDICMPEMDGCQATRRIHDIPYLSRVPVVAMSAHWARDWSEEAIDAGCAECVSKPLELERIDQIISRYVH
jgi:two-component system, cell cycle response regulator DivK